MNLCIFMSGTLEAEFPHIECIIPYQPMAMKAVYCPIDTSLNFSQANKLIKDLKPSLLVTSEDYLKAPVTHPHRTDFVIDYPNIQKISSGSVITLKLKRLNTSAFMDSLLATEVEPSAPDESGTFASTITATLNNMDNKYRLVKVGHLFSGFTVVSFILLQCARVTIYSHLWIYATHGNAPQLNILGAL